MPLPEIAYIVLTPSHLFELKNRQHRADINTLVAQLGPGARLASWEYFCEVVQESHIVIAQEWGTERRAILGIACLAEVTALTRRVGQITHIVVHEKYRRCGIGTGLIRRLLAAARDLRLPRVDLTSHASRTAAQEFWLNQGFQKRETNNFRLELT